LIYGPETNSYGDLRCKAPPGYHTPPVNPAMEYGADVHAKTKARHQAGFRETRKSGLMFNGRSRFNGLAAGKPVCALRLDSGGSEVKRKNRASKIPFKLLIINGFLRLTDLKSAGSKQV
jgi:hypothetical protein